MWWSLHPARRIEGWRLHRMTTWNHECTNNTCQRSEAMSDTSETYSSLLCRPSVGQADEGCGDTGPGSCWCMPIQTNKETIYLKARLHGSPRLINPVESTKVNRVNSSFQRKWSTGLTGEQVGDGQLSFVVDSLWVTHHRLPVCVLFLYVWFYFW